MSQHSRCVLCVSGHDPVGGAGLQAEIETLGAFGVHAVGVISALTVQDSRNVRRVIATDPALLREQLSVLLDDVEIAAVKLGLVADAAQLPVIVEALSGLPTGLPVVCDPVLRAGGGRELVTAGYLAALRTLLLPRVTLATPNLAEARRLAGPEADAEACADAWLAAGCRAVLVTGGDVPGARVRDLLVDREGRRRAFEAPRLAETFHGAGCTLAAAIAARLAQGAGLETAVDDAWRWTRDALEHPAAIGRGRRIPGRIPRSRPAP